MATRDATTTDPMITSKVERERLIFPGLQPFYDALAPYMYPLFRFTVGATLIPHGVAKLMNGVDKFAPSMARLGIAPATEVAYFIIFLEIVGGACVAIGLLTRLFAAAVAIEFAVITFAVHLPIAWFAGQRGGEYPLMWGIFFLCIALRGGGKLSVDCDVLKREL
ncbi:MAG TPA: DoxX family protein [Alphaproteobacteria bacterium]